ncbi:hypothetical protein COLO4_33339 [Corchorus olitorius]|uniref:Uncharacterized protein n=1 Tax=Corchorus olitorius TaxID=93759 RepID=A0A1R3GUS9_9ROSI|nr:hypothetical protein COLO4_33339 [Corchorus olitorius]
MFLLCNGLLVFIATSSGLITTYSVEKSESKAEKSIKSKESSEKKGFIAKVKQVAAEVDQETQDSKMESNLALSQETEAIALVAEEEKEEEQRNEAVVVVEEDEDGGFGSMSDEELNRKCEDFIRKMKEGIKFEARQLIMVQ